MIMHPALTTSGKKKGKKKFASAAAKHQYLALEQAWIQKQQVWSEMSRVGIQPTIKITPLAANSVKTPAIPSLNSWVTGAVSSKPNPVYTGSAVLGISVLHKSNGVPVFSREAAIDISQMRR